MNRLYNHTRWDGTTVERHTSRRGRPFMEDPEPDYLYGHPEFIGPPTALAKVCQDYSEFYKHSRR